MIALLSSIVLTVASSGSDPALVEDVTSNAVAMEASFFEGRWAFADESCDVPTNWTMLAGGNFISEDLTGTWQWNTEKGSLLLRLTDLAIDEETEEAGGRFQMDGPVAIQSPDTFKFTIEPEIYELKRCPETPVN